MLNISKSTVCDIVKRFKREDRIESIPQKGRPKKLDLRDTNKIIRKIKKNPILNASQLASELLEESGKNVNPQTIRNVLKKAGYKFCAKVYFEGYMVE
jgi:transposase